MHHSDFPRAADKTHSRRSDVSGEVKFYTESGPLLSASGDDKRDFTVNP